MHIVMFQVIFADVDVEWGEDGMGWSWEKNNINYIIWGLINHYKKSLFHSKYSR